MIVCQRQGVASGIHHVALWTRDVERLRDFYCTYFGGVAGDRYENPAKGFVSYFVRFPGGGAALEIMCRCGVDACVQGEHLGYCHLAFSWESREEVVRLTEDLRAGGYPVLSEPRETGDGYFESVAADPDGNRVEMVFDPRSVGGAMGE